MGKLFMHTFRSWSFPDRIEIPACSEDLSTSGRLLREWLCTCGEEVESRFCLSNMGIGRLDLIGGSKSSWLSTPYSPWAETVVTAGSWFAVWTTARHEKTVSRLLALKGFETFLPLYRRKHRYARHVREFVVPLFPGYLFCRTDLASRFLILTTPGVLQMVGAGRNPIPVEDREIESLQKIMASGFCVAPHPFARSGQTARIIAGPLLGIEGIVVHATDLSACRTVRIVLSVNLLRRSVLLEIDRDRVALLPDRAGSVA